jgi:GAF domain-containing protein
MGVSMVAEYEQAITEDCRELQDALIGTESIEAFLHEMAVLAARLGSNGSGGVLSCGMTMRSHGRPVTVACSDPLAAQVDEVQYALDDGPCLHAMRDGHVVRIEDTADKARWPEFEARAAARGIRSCLALPLRSGPLKSGPLKSGPLKSGPPNSDGPTVGVLNLYARTASAFGAAEARRAENFAQNASGALTLAMRMASHAALIEQLRSSLVSRTVIDQALGIIMARERCGRRR